MGLAHARAAALRGLKVAVVEREARCVGASILNFGFVTLTGQAPEETLRRARRSAGVWREVAASTGLPVLHERLLLALSTPEGRAVAEAYAADPGAPRCEVWSPRRAREEAPTLTGATEGILVGHEDLRVEAALAIPTLAEWLSEEWGVAFRWSCPALSVEAGVVTTPQGELEADHVFVCPGDALDGPFSPPLAARQTVRCALQMVRLAPSSLRLPGIVMSELGMIRYPGYLALPEVDALRARLLAEQPAVVADGVHLIAVQNPDGSVIVGDSHAYAQTPDPFQRAETEARILGALVDVIGPIPPVVARWTGTYAYAPGEPVIVAPLDRQATLVVVARGKGMSVGFALGEEGIDRAFGSA